MGFYDENWDFGIMQQALWTGSHGQGFYNSGSSETIGASSFFQVHPSFMLYPLAAIYWVFPSGFTLLAVQSVVVALAAIPLYALTVSITRSSGKSLWVAVLYLAWTPLLASQMYDVHLEAFLPLELFSLFYFWYLERWVATVVSAVVAMLTLEIGPLFVISTALFFLVPQVRWGWLERIKGHLLGRPQSGAWQASSELRLAWPERRTILMGLFMGVLAGATYLLLRMLQGPWSSIILGGSVPSSGKQWGFTPSSLGLGWGFLEDFLGAKLEYWVLVYALVLFVPLLCPRALLLGLPWMLFTFFSPDLNYVSIGFQYSLVAAYGVFVGMAFGVRKLPVTTLRAFVARFVSSIRALVRSRGSRFPGLRELYRSGGLVAGLAIVLVVNLAVGPANPLTTTPSERDAYPPGYWNSFDHPPGFQDVQRLAQLVPVGAYVVATTELFPFVANNVHAYSFYWYPTNGSYLPFNASHLPQFVLYSDEFAPTVPSWLSAAIFKNYEFGLRASVVCTSVGSVYLYELGYSWWGPVYLQSDCTGHS
ncbi:MAG: DUF2079 domain-containing protein [Euryarchaeota archaeon]|nr:DUF2079 domain-containing protein [Euryarchaeota archaeon]MDE1837244.1 DUF2079 domain-containing protein [Euryarchaeota archaeon]MDE1881615.1 DUF2079 domain-containing protein [Euryarchaeota archaeon]MDE2045152.1 DUF2079 domain-containing protein [Thermoplasmata archaeon]